MIHSRTDPLTGILNRQAILERIESEMDRASRKERPLSLSLLGIDLFKKINDAYKHAAGDEVLCECTRQINAALRTYDSPGRPGGEEFLIVLPETDSSIAFSIAERIRSSIAENELYLEGSRINVTSSQGVQTWDGNAEMANLIAWADKAMYRAKENGRNRTIVGMNMCMELIRLPGCVPSV